MKQRIEPPNMKPENDPPCPVCRSNNTSSPYWAGEYRSCNSCGASWQLGRPCKPEPDQLDATRHGKTLPEQNTAKPTDPVWDSRNSDEPQQNKPKEVMTTEKPTINRDSRQTLHVQDLSGVQSVGPVNTGAAQSEQNTQHCPRCGTMTDQPFHTCKGQNTQRPSDETELSREERPTVATGKIVWAAPQTEAGDVSDCLPPLAKRLVNYLCSVDIITMGFQDRVGETIKLLHEYTRHWPQRISELEAECKAWEESTRGTHNQMALSDYVESKLGFLDKDAHGAPYLIDAVVKRLAELEKENERLRNEATEHDLTIQRLHDSYRPAEARVKELESKLAAALKVTTGATLAHVGAQKENLDYKPKS